MVELLLQSKTANVDCRANVSCTFDVYFYISSNSLQGDVTALHYASREGHLAVVEVLLKYGANCGVRNDVSVRMFVKFTCMPALVRKLLLVINNWVHIECSP